MLNHIKKASLFAFLYSVIGTLCGTVLFFGGPKFYEIIDLLILCALTALYVWLTTKYLNKWLYIIVIPCIYIIYCLLFLMIINTIVHREGMMEFYSIFFLVYNLFNFYCVLMGAFIGFILSHLMIWRIKK